MTSISKKIDSADVIYMPIARHGSLYMNSKTFIGGDFFKLGIMN